MAKSSDQISLSETNISRAIADYLDARGIYHLRLNSGKARGLKGSGIIHLCPPGTPDRHLIYNPKNSRFGIPGYIEVKKPGEKPSPEQLAAHQRIRESGGFVIVAEDVTDVINGFKELDGKISAELDKEKNK